MKEYQYESFYGERALFNSRGLKIINSTFSDGESPLKESEDISYQMTVNKKRYDAYFTFVDESINGYVWYTIAEQFGRYKIVMFYENNDNAANGDDL